MEQAEFTKYVEVLEQKPFTIYPAPVGPDNTVAWHCKKFIYREDSRTHLTIEDAATGKVYQLPLALVEFANPGILGLTHVVAPSNGSFI